ncbi:MAG: hypothetical protein GEV09_26795, partial [Pseudonocardiaceae bacterium]|nr:hypothetical protein [Pseudonocardiaceae bacterium]
MLGAGHRGTERERGVGVDRAKHVADARAAVECGADGVGLLRTELAYLERATPPSEDEQVADLAAMFAELGERPVVVRTLDIGGD